MARLDPQIAAHLEWIGFVRPTGLVVSAPALVKAGALLNRRDTEGQQLLRGCLEDRGRDAAEGAPEPEPRLPDFRSFASSVLGWNFSPAGYAGTDDAPIPAELEAVLPDGGEVLRPDFAVRAEPVRRSAVGRPASAVREDAAAYGTAGVNGATGGPNAEREGTAPNGASPWQLLVRVCEPDEDFDHVTRGRSRADGGLEASPHGRMERLLRHTGVPAGLLFNGTALRLISAPRGESSGWLDFRVADMLPTAGRPISTAMRLLLGQTRLLSQPREKRLAALLEDSRKYQNEVSERLAEQVLHALYELLRGFQAAHDTSKGELLREPLAENPDEVYRGLLTIVLRLVFLLYTEERDMLPQDETFLGAYSLAGLYERLRADAALHPDTMDQRFGGYAQLLALFRMVHDGAKAGAMRLPPRHGALFDPDRYRFLEGRGEGGVRQINERIDPPLVPDGTIYRVLEKLIVLDGERISYRALDVEHVGSVYETMMGFRLETAEGLTVAIRAAKKQGAPAAVNLNAQLDQAPAIRAKWLQDRTDRKLTDRLRRAARDAGTMEALHAALDPVIDRNATPDLVPEGAMVLQPSEERRRSGSHYTPRELTEPIVRTALAPIFDRLRFETDEPLRPEQILDLKVCDPAMGSGAFLVEACRQLGDALVEAWQAHDAMPEIPPDENEIIFARRQVAQRCLYGVDRNPKAVDLAKLSLWLVTLAKDHPLTFLDHALRPGDALVGLSRRQLHAFHWKDDAKPFQAGFEAMRAREHLARASELRQRIREADDSVSELELRQLCDDADRETDNVRLLGDLALAAFFEGAKPKQREDLRKQFAGAVQRGEMHGYVGWLEELRRKEPPLAPFHWEIEFPEVFDRENSGFDAVVGNPPFAGKNTVAAANVAGYPDWLKQVHEESHGNADLVAHFFRRAFVVLRNGGTSGLIATNTIAQGDTRSTGLRRICKNGGEIYGARRRVKWPGLAAVVVSVLHVHKGHFAGVRLLDGEAVDTISAFLFHRGRHDDPARLEANAGKSFVGSYVLGMGFTFDDTDKKGVASPLAEMHRLIEADPRNREVIFPYIGGEEVNTSPTHAHHRYVINFRDWPLRRADRQAQASKTWTPGSADILSARAGGLPRIARRRPEIVPVGTMPASPEQPPLLGRATSSESRPTSPETGQETIRNPANRDRDDDAKGERGGGDDRSVEMASWAGATDAERREWLRSGVVPVDYPGPVAADWPELVAIVEERVKPERQAQQDKVGRIKWWQFLRPRPELHAAISDLDRVLVIARVGQQCAFVFLDVGAVYSDQLIVVPFDTYAAFCLLQSRPHDIWARFFGSSMKDDLRYTPSDCFETFPFPNCATSSEARPTGDSPDSAEAAPGDRWRTQWRLSDDWVFNPRIEAAGKACYEHRAALMVRNNEGMTKTYNRFHDPYENTPDISRLRELHAAMDRAVLDEYGWTDIPTNCEFLLDYEIDEATWGRKNKPYRYRWPDPIRDEVLARLLALNAERAAEEVRSGATTDASRRASMPRPAQSRYRRAPASRSTHMVAGPEPLWPPSDD